MSPKKQTTTSGRPARAIARSRYSTGVTHTGHPGPEISLTESGSMARNPAEAMAWVWVPQTSMIEVGRSNCVLKRLISATRPAIAAGSLCMFEE